MAKLAKVAKVAIDTKVAEVEKSGKMYLWFDQIQIMHMPFARASRWLTVRSASPVSLAFNVQIQNQEKLTIVDNFSSSTIL